MNIIYKNVIKNKCLCINYRPIWNFCEMSTQNVDKTLNEAKHYDMIIVGGGPVGLTMASAISKNSKLSDRKVLLLDGAPKFNGYSKDKYSNRVYSINESTVNLMKSIGAWETIKSIRCQPVKQMQVWDASSGAYINFNHDGFAMNVAYIVENDVVLHAVLKELSKNGNVLVKNQSKIESVSLISNEQSKNLVKMNTGEAYSCDLLIGADGANSIVRKEMGVDSLSLSYDQMGLIATVELKEEDDNHIAWQRFLPDGVIALLPLSDKLSSVVWSTQTSMAKHLLTLSEEDFVDALNEAFWKHYPRDQLTDNAFKAFSSIMGNLAASSNRGPLPPGIKGVYEKSRALFPLGFGHTSTYATTGAVLIGDSAHRIHPLAGQGLNLGFGDVQLLTEILAKASYNGGVLSDIKYLREYERKRLQHNVPIMLGVHALQCLYGSNLAPIVLLRSIGLQMTHAISPIKKLFMEKAMH